MDLLLIMLQLPMHHTKPAASLRLKWMHLNMCTSRIELASAQAEVMYWARLLAHYQEQIDALKERQNRLATAMPHVPTNGTGIHSTGRELPFIRPRMS